MAAKTPVLVDPTTFGAGFNWYAGPFEYAGALYLVYSDNESSPAKVAIFKSTDAGDSWTRQDTGNEITFDTRHCSNFAGGVITIAYNPSADTKLAFIDFDCSTDTYGSPVTGGPSDGTSANHPFFVFRLSTGATRLVYRYTPATRFRAYYVEYDGGWGSPSELSDSLASARNAQIKNAFMDSGERIHVVFQSLQALSPPYPLIYRRINADGSFSSEATIYSPSSSGSNYLGRGSVFGGNVWFPYKDAASDNLYGFQLGAPDEEPPALDSMPLLFSDSDVIENFSLVDGALLYFWFISFQTSPTDVDAIYYMTFDGASWSDPVLFHDEFANPTHPDESFQFLHNLEVLKTAAGTWAVGTALEYTPEGESTKCVGHFIGEEGAFPLAYFGIGNAVSDGGAASGLFI